MFGKNPRLNAIDSRKQLLIAESELNRAHLVGDLAALSASVRALADRAKSFNSIASSAAVLGAGLAAFRRRQPLVAEVKPSWLQTVLKGAGLVSNLWLAFGSRGRNHQDQQPNPRA